MATEEVKFDGTELTRWSVTIVTFLYKYTLPFIISYFGPEGHSLFILIFNADTAGRRDENFGTLYY